MRPQQEKDSFLRATAKLSHTPTLMYYLAKWRKEREDYGNQNQVALQGEENRKETQVVAAPDRIA